MYNMMDYEEPRVTALYFAMLIFIGAFFLINLILAVVHRAFINIEHEELVRDFNKEKGKLDEVIQLLKKESALYDSDKCKRIAGLEFIKDL